MKFGELAEFDELTKICDWLLPVYTKHHIAAQCCSDIDASKGL